VPQARYRAAIEWPTVALALGIYGGWGVLTWWHDEIPTSLSIALGAWLVAWQSSLQHEVIHGHPTRHRWLNDAIGRPALWLWIPFDRYRAMHLAHHRDEWLTDPIDDPESAYVTADAWASLGRTGRVLLLSQRTLAGRLLLGPIWSLVAFWRGEARLLAADAPGVRRAWLLHLPAAALVLGWTLAIAGVPAWWLAACSFAGTSLAMIRSFAEHRPAREPDHRTAVVEGAPLLGLLFLNNNLHVVHHARPGVPWYRLPRLFRTQREAWLERNGGLVYRGYAEIAARYLFRLRDHPVHASAQMPSIAPASIAAARRPKPGPSGRSSSSIGTIARTTS